MLELANLNKPITLVGMMGAGKTTIGRRLARRLGVEFFDVDREIEIMVSCRISDIFHYAGEAYYNKYEEKVIAHILAKTNKCVLATGGGTFAIPTVREKLLNDSICVWIDVPENTLVERVHRTSHRPMLEDVDKKQVMHQLLQERIPFYSQAHIKVKYQGGNHNAVVSQIIHRLSEYNI